MDDNHEASAGNHLLITLSETEGITVVTVHGEVDRDSAPSCFRP